MITRDEAERILYQILDDGLLPIATNWAEVFAAKGCEKETIERGLNALEALFSATTPCVLHGWIDQAALEIVEIGQLSSLRDRAINYRADQGGDTGILALNNGKAVILAFSFEQGKAVLEEYSGVG